MITPEMRTSPPLITLSLEYPEWRASTALAHDIVHIGRLLKLSVPACVHVYVYAYACAISPS